MDSFGGPELVVREIHQLEQELLREVFRLRVACRDGDGVITWKSHPDGWCDEMDVVAFHVGVLHAGRVVAAGRMVTFDRISLHPYFPAFQHIVPECLSSRPIAYLSRDQVDESFRGRGLRGELLHARERRAMELGIGDLFIDVAHVGPQLTNFQTDGYRVLGPMQIGSIPWELGESLLMHKDLRGCTDTD